MNLKKIFAYFTTYKDDERDVQKEKAKLVAALIADKNIGQILYKKEFIIINRKINKYEFPERISSYKDLMLTDKGLSLVGTRAVENFNYTDIYSVVHNEQPDFSLCTYIELTFENKKLYIYSAKNPLWGGHLNTFVELDIKKELEKDFSEILSILEARGYKKRT